jgi:bacillithiol biosynthesis cysteine-adding enzyme BshC
VTLRIVPTPLNEPFSAPTPREGGVRAELLPAFVRVPGHEQLLAPLERSDVLFVTTGQQPALFTGPLYTIHKALSAAALADSLGRRWGRPVVPVFLVCGDDHDFAEASHAEWLTADGSVGGAALPLRPADAPLTPMYRESLGEGVTAAIKALEHDLGPSEFRDLALDWIRRHFRPDATVAGSFAAALAELLAPHGILVIDSTHRAVKQAAAPLLMRALALAPELDRALADRAQELMARGQDPGIAVGEGAALVMVEGRMGRDRLIRHGPDFTTRRGKSVSTLTELEALAAREPERFSPNVLLRPVVESALLPTVAYLGGPGELRYLRLTPPIYQKMGVSPQRPLPRFSGVLVEPRIDRVLDKFGITLADLMQPAGVLEARLVRSRLPDDAVVALAALRRAIEAQYETIGRAAGEIDPTLAQPVAGAKHQALGGIQDVEKKLLQHLKKRQETELGQVTRARNAVWPNGKPQERVFTIAPYLARHGPALLGDLLDAIRGWYEEALERASDPA